MKADGLAKTEAIWDVAEVAERVPKEAMDTREHVSAAKCMLPPSMMRVDELVDVEEVAEERKIHPSSSSASRKRRCESTDWSDQLKVRSSLSAYGVV